MIITFYTPEGEVHKDLSELTQEEKEILGLEYAEELNGKHEWALQALAHWDQVTLQQKDTLLKNLIWWALICEGYKPPDV